MSSLLMPNKAVESHGRRANATVHKQVCIGAAPTRLNEGRNPNERLWEHILLVFGSEDGIDFAYPTRRTFVNHIEGKPDAKAPAWPPAPK